VQLSRRLQIREALIHLVEADKAKPAVEQHLGGVQLEAQPDLLVVAAGPNVIISISMPEFGLEGGRKEDAHGLVIAEVPIRFSEVAVRKVIARKKEVRDAALKISVPSSALLQ
jgi:hypothetical protein